MAKRSGVEKVLTPILSVMYAVGITATGLFPLIYLQIPWRYCIGLIALLIVGIFLIGWLFKPKCMAAINSMLLLVLYAIALCSIKQPLESIGIMEVLLFAFLSLFLIFGVLPILVDAVEKEFDCGNRRTGFILGAIYLEILLTVLTYPLVFIGIGWKSSISISVTIAILFFSLRPKLIIPVLIRLAFCGIALFCIRLPIDSRDAFLFVCIVTFLAHYGMQTIIGTMKGDREYMESRIFTNTSTRQVTYKSDGRVFMSAFAQRKRDDKSQKR